MPCHKPLVGYRSKFKNATGKRSIVFNTNDGYTDQEVIIPCGRCDGCRLEYSRQWAVRCVHEASEHPANSFITLTYNEENLPEDLSIHKEHLQKFFKRLRRHLERKAEREGTPVTRFKYYACGEYGDRNNRPHYHAILFGIDFYEDRELHSVKRGNYLYRSPTLEKLWPFGFSLIGEMSFESAAYVARYVRKKRKGDPDTVDKNGKTNRQYYERIDPDTGEIHQVEPEFCLPSRGSGKADDPTIWRKGIGASWYEKYKGDTKKDYIHVRGHKQKLPKYYDAMTEIEDELLYRQKKVKRKRMAKKMAHDNTQERLDVKAAVLEAKTQTLIRDL